MDMRRVTIKEAASLLGIDEEAVRAQILSGRLVACQDAQYRGYVWVRENTEAPPTRRPTGKSAGRKGRADTGKSSPETPPAARATEPPARKEPRAKPEEGERRPRTSQRAQEIQLLQETVALLKEELKAKDRQLELKNAELEARREEVRGLLGILNQSRALPAPDDRRAAAAGGRTGLHSGLSLAMEKASSVIKRLLDHLSNLVSRVKGVAVSDDQMSTITK